MAMSTSAPYDTRVREAVRAAGIHLLPNFSGHSNVILERVKGGQVQPGTKVVRIYVRKKVSADQLAPGEVIPNEITVDGTQYETDVVQLDAKALSAPAPPLVAKTRPVSLGYSIGHKSITAGTLGAVVYIDGQPFFLSNNHVFAAQSSIQAQRADIGDAVLQPGPYDQGTFSNADAGDAVGALYSFIPLDEVGTNLVDCALVAPLDIGLVDNVYGPPISSQLTGFYQTYAVGDSYQYLGRTSGYKKVTVTDPSANLSVGYESFTAQFEDVIVFTPSAIPGDSGSGLLNGTELAGLLFAGDQTDNVGIGCKISNVLTAFSAKGLSLSFQGPPPPPPTSPSSIAFVSESLSLLGTFPSQSVVWQGGSITSPVSASATLVLKDGTGAEAYNQSVTITVWPASQNHTSDVIYPLTKAGPEGPVSIDPGTYQATAYCTIGGTPASQVASFQVVIPGTPPPPPSPVLTASISQTPGQYPVWAISGVTPNGTFTVYEYVNGSGGTIFVYKANAQGTDGRAFNPHASAGSQVYILVVDDATANRVMSNTITLAALPSSTQFSA